MICSERMLFVLAGCFSILLTGCGLIPSTLDVKHVREPDVLVTQPIGVMTFNNDFEDNSITELTRSALARSRFNGQDVHEVVSADSLPTNSRENPEKIRRNYPVRTLISGKIKRTRSMEKTKTDEKVEVCVEERAALQLDFDCDKYKEVYAPKIIRKYKLVLFYKIDDLTQVGLEHGGKISAIAKDSVVLKDMVNPDFSITELLDDDPELESFESLSMEARRELPDKLIEKITPYREEITAYLLQPAESSPRYSFIQSALDLADDNKIGRACRRLNKVYESNVRTTVVLYNNGLCQEHKGTLDRAEEFYLRAKDNATPEQNQVIEEGLNRIIQAERNRKSINEAFPVEL